MFKRQTQRLAWIILILLGSCGPVRPLPTATPTSSQIPIPTITLTFTPSPTSTSTPTPDADRCLRELGVITSHELEGTQYPIPFRFLVYLPPCYDERTDQRYPVLYLLHGQNYDNDQWIRMGAASIADRLIADGSIDPMIMIFPYDKYSYQPIEDTFDEVLIYDLVPWVDVHYRTNPGAANRAIGGVSRGGGWAIHLGLKYWELFGAIGAHSPARFISDRASLYNWVQEIPVESIPRIYIDISDNDQEYKSVVDFENLLTLIGVPHEWHPNQGFHNEEYWSRHNEEYLRWYAEGWMQP